MIDFKKDALVLTDLRFKNGTTRSASGSDYYQQKTTQAYVKHNSRNAGMDTGSR